MVPFWRVCTKVVLGGGSMPQLKGAGSRDGAGSRG